MASAIGKLHFNGSSLFRLYNVDLMALSQRFLNTRTKTKQASSVTEPTALLPDFDVFQKKTVCLTYHGTQFRKTNLNSNRTYCCTNVTYHEAFQTYSCQLHTQTDPLSFNALPTCFRKMKFYIKL
jgi:hypothetical protein